MSSRAPGDDGAASVVMARAGLIAVAALAVVLVACKREEGEQVASLARSGDAALVVIVDRSSSGVALVEEEEPNDEVDTAHALEIPGGVRGTLDGEADADLVRLDVDEALQLSAVVTGAADVDLILDVVDEGGEQVARSDRAPAGNSEGVANLPLQAGRYYVTVHEFVRGRERGSEGGREGPSEPYELVIERHEPDTGYEIEPNEDRESASELEIDRDAFGYVGWHQDVDVFEIPLAGVLDTDGLDIALTGVPWVSPVLEILDDHGEVLLSRKGERGEAVHVHHLAARHAVGDADDDSLFLRVRSPRSNPEQPYRLRVTRDDLEPNSELEPNHEPDLATPLRDSLDESEGARRGHLDLGDVDTYQLGASPGPRVLHASVEPSSAVRARVEVVVDGVTLGEAEGPGRGASVLASGIEIPAGRSAYIVVRGDTDDPAGGRYELRWALH